MSEDSDLDFARRLGGRLRAVRVQKRWSLHDVQVAAEGEFSAAAVGSYERGERLISVPRLNRLAGVYRVPLEELLPPEQPGDARRDEGEAEEAGPGRLVIDLTALDRLGEREWEPIRRFSRSVQARRGDFNGRVLTVRAEDARGLAMLCGREVGEIEELIGFKAAAAAPASGVMAESRPR
jgi:transcriptional regulator with XRE-family HTH domain